jgi:putative Mg2+ transporter-C (MgtC) family protein
MKLFTFLSEVNTWSIIVRLLLAVVCGGVIGIERGRRRQAAGFRTHILVCMGSALVMITNICIIRDLSTGQDPTRIAAQVVSGIGFLGAGTIIVTGNKQIRGLTTAAGLWASACMGLAIGAGYYIASIIACILIFLVMTLLNNVDKWAYQHSKVLDLYIEFQDIQYVSAFLTYLRSRDMKTSNIEITKSRVPGETSISALMTLHLTKRMDHSQLLSTLSEVEGVNFIEELL